jgi:formylglycine-generating enzyme required for sulfatase activity/serine/threonine protein kinase
MELKTQPERLEETRVAGSGGEHEVHNQAGESSKIPLNSAPPTLDPPDTAGSFDPTPDNAAETVASEGDHFLACKGLGSLQTGSEIGPDNHRFRLIRLLEERNYNRLWLAQDLAASQADTPIFKTLNLFALQLQDFARLQEAATKDDGVVKSMPTDLINLRSHLVKMRVRVEQAAQLNHPNIAKIYGWRQGKDGWLFIEMEYADQRSGSSLDRLLRSQAKPELGWQRTLELLYPVAEALDYAHREHRLAHRAVKAENIFISALGTVKVLNFGLEGYELRDSRNPSMAQEALSGQDPKAESQATDLARFKQDVSALAALIYQMLTGQWSDSGQLFADQEFVKRLPKPAELSDATWKVLQQGLNYRAEGCPASAVELVQRLGAVRKTSRLTQGRQIKALFQPLAWVALGILIGSGGMWYLGQRLPALGRTAQPPPVSAGMPAATTTLGTNIEVTAKAGMQTAQSVQAETPQGVADTLPQQQEEEQIRREMDDSAYAAAQRISTPIAYRIYLQRCPDCGHREAAQEAIKELERRAKIAEFKARFETHLQARELNGSDLNGNHAMGALQALEAFDPQDPFIGEGRQRVALVYGELARESMTRGNFAEARQWLAKGESLQPGLEALGSLSSEIDNRERKFQDDVAYNRAQGLNSQQSYQAYLASCGPLCGHRSEAEEALERLKTMPPSMTNTVFRDQLAEGSSGPEMVLIPAGSFMLGSALEERGRFSDERQHLVQIPKAFAISKYEITFEDYDKFAKATGRQKPDDKGWGRGRRPVINVDWNDALAYSEWLSAQTGQRYRLPTEAEWEYAARAGTQTSRYWGNDPDKGCDYANGADLTGKTKFPGWNAMNCQDGYVYTAPVGSYKPNPFGLYDMLGNVLEWTCSAYDENYAGAEQRCEDKERAHHLVGRGGSWSDEPRSMRSADRYKGTPEFRDYFLGFRVVRQL